MSILLTLWLFCYPPLGDPYFLFVPGTPDYAHERTSWSRSFR